MSIVKPSLRGRDVFFSFLQGFYDRRGKKLQANTLFKT